MSANNEQFSESPCLMQIKFFIYTLCIFYIYIYIFYIFYIFYTSLFFYFSFFILFFIFQFLNFSIFLLFSIILFYVCCALIRMIVHARHFQHVDLLLREFIFLSDMFIL